MELYKKAVKAWGRNLPQRLANLPDKSDDRVFTVLADILGDILAPDWETDSRIAWALMQGREA